MCGVAPDAPGLVAGTYHVSNGGAGSRQAASFRGTVCSVNQRNTVLTCMTVLQWLVCAQHGTVQNNGLTCKHAIMKWPREATCYDDFTRQETSGALIVHSVCAASGAAFPMLPVRCAIMARLSWPR